MAQKEISGLETDPYWENRQFVTEVEMVQLVVQNSPGNFETKWPLEQNLSMSGGFNSPCVSREGQRGKYHAASPVLEEVTFSSGPALSSQQPCCSITHSSPG